MQVQFSSMNIICACLLVFFIFIIDNKVDGAALRSNKRNAVLHDKSNLFSLLKRKQSKLDALNEEEGNVSRRTFDDRSSESEEKFKKRFFKSKNKDESESDEKNFKARQSNYTDGGGNGGDYGGGESNDTDTGGDYGNGGDYDGGSTNDTDTGRDYGNGGDYDGGSTNDTDTEGNNSGEDEREERFANYDDLYNDFDDWIE